MGLDDALVKAAGKAEKRRAGGGRVRLEVGEI